MQYNDGVFNLQGETFWLDAEYTADEIGYSSSSDNSFIKNTQKGIMIGTSNSMKIIVRKTI